MRMPMPQKSQPLTCAPDKLVPEAATPEWMCLGQNDKKPWNSPIENPYSTKCLNSLNHRAIYLELRQGGGNESHSTSAVWNISNNKAPMAFSVENLVAEWWGNGEECHSGSEPLTSVSASWKIERKPLQHPTCHRSRRLFGAKITNELKPKQRHVAVLEKHHVTNMLPDSFTCNSSFEVQLLSDEEWVWYDSPSLTVARKTLPFWRWRFHLYLRRPLIHWPWQMRRQMRLRAICQRSTGRHHGIQVMVGDFFSNFLRPVDFICFIWFHAVFHLRECWFCFMEVIVNFATSAVEEFMIAKREREEYKALAKPKGNSICLANVGLKGCLHWILGPSDHQVAFAMAYFWVQPIFSIL